VRVFGIDPGSQRTGFGCVESDGRRHRLVICGAIRVASRDAFAVRLGAIFRELSTHLQSCRPDVVAVENLFHAVNVRSALTLGHARGVAMLAAFESGVPVVEYTPAEVKRAVVGYGRAEKPQVQQMVKLLLGLARVPSPHVAADALAVAICHLHNGKGLLRARAERGSAEAEPRNQARSSGGPGLQPGPARSSTWRTYKPIRPA
jgi:crossover junction endodeoxyribonuclease RuvC